MSLQAKVNEPAALPVQRLCNEIQLFDLCDLDNCSSKSGRFCTNTDLLKQFETIEEEEVRRPTAYRDDEHDETDADFDEFGTEDEFDDDGFDDDYFEGDDE